VLVLLYSVEQFEEHSRNIECIRRLYMNKYQQQSVLRVDAPFFVWVSFQAT
jgi:Protein of unknown function (DUF3574)